LYIYRGFAPLFGVNANFHILPFLVKSKDCHWDLYLTAKYGGCYLPHVEFEDADNDYPYGKYRHEYGLGIGICYYFKNIIGLYAEGAVGQFSFYPNPFLVDSESNLSFRIGRVLKF